MMKQLGSFLAYDSNSSTLSECLIQAYAASDFPIRLAQGSTAIVNVGEQCAALDQQLLAQGEETAVILSASSTPLGKSVEENLVFFGVTYENAVNLAVEYGQSAFVWYVLSSRAKLVVVD